MQPPTSTRDRDSAWLINYLLTAAALIALGLFTLATSDAKTTAGPFIAQLTQE